jgi:hypothetical protein
MVVRSRGFPALETPCSCATDPHRQGDRIGLTGTPIENTATDPWAIMDQMRRAVWIRSRRSSVAMARRPRKTWRTFIGSCSSHAVLFRRLPAQAQIGSVHSMSLASCAINAAKDQDANRAAVSRQRSHAVLGAACLWTDQDRKVDGWQTLTVKPSNQPIDLAA